MLPVAFEVDAFPLTKMMHAGLLDDDLELTKEHVDEFLPVMTVGTVAVHTGFDEPALAIHHIPACRKLFDPQAFSKRGQNLAAIGSRNHFLVGFGQWRGHEGRQRHPVQRSERLCLGDLNAQRSSLHRGQHRLGNACLSRNLANGQLACLPKGSQSCADGIGRGRVMLPLGAFCFPRLG